jgi:hypothetical protein
MQMHTTETEIDTRALLDEYVAAVQEMYVRQAEARPYASAPDSVGVDMGRRFARVWHDNHTQRSVHAFVDMETGDVIKAAGWKAPQKDRDGFAVRYRLADPEDKARCFESMDPYGSYLYKR